MKTIKENTINEIEIKNSRFICLLIKIDSIDITNILENIKIKYPKANHYCYGYIFGNYKKCSDDKEPSRTAGAPILGVLEKEKLNNILCVVVRYFGGIKLGAGGLIRAYTKSVTETLKIASLIELEKGYLIEISFSYDNIGEYDYLFRNSNITTKEYSNNVIYKVIVNETILNKLTNYKILDTMYIEKV